MTSEEFDQLVNRIQQGYGHRPLALRMRIAFLLLLGYAGFLAVLLLVMTVSGLLVAGAVALGQEPGIFLMAVVAVLLAFGISHALVFLWVPMQPQEGCEITRAMAPRLFELLDLLQRRLRVSAFHHVRITSDFNAAVLMIPRLGVFGWNTSYLYLGLPLMHATTLDQFTAVLAHELAHSSSRHDRFGVWIYRLRQTWSRLFAELHETQSSGLAHQWRRVILGFVDWYWPRFHAHAFVLSRSDEYEADRRSAECAGTANTAQALFLIECLNRRLSEKFWEDLTHQARGHSEVADNLMELMLTFLSAPAEPADAARWKDQAAQALTGTEDTHPSLSDRLRSLGHTVAEFAATGFPVLPNPSAAEVLLPPSLGFIAENVNQQWKKDNTLRWQNLYHQARRLERQLESVAGSPPPEAADTGAAAFDVEQAWKHACLVGDLQGVAAAEPLLRNLLQQDPTHALANIMLGRHLLEHGVPEGEFFVRRVLELDDHDLVPAACQSLIHYFQQQGLVDQLREARSQLSRFETAQAEAARERRMVTAADRFIPHELDRDALAAVCQHLKEQSELAGAWLVRKDVQHFRKKALFVLVVQSRGHGFWGRASAEADHQLVSRLVGKVTLPGRVLIIAPQGGFAALARKIMALPGARLVS